MQIPNTNDGSQREPYLRIYGNDWGLLELPRLPRERAWTYEETLDQIKAAGFHGMQAGGPNAPAVRGRGLGFCMTGRANTPQEVDAVAAGAEALQAESLALHVGWGWETDAEIDGLCEAVLTATARYEVPIFIETHRATITQDMYRTLRMIERNPEIRINGDFSHYYCGHEAPYPGFETFHKMLQPVLERCGTFHGRISDGECMQVNVGDGRTHVHAQNFKTLWREAMGHWLRGAGPGDYLIFCPELGPPSSGYAITHMDEQGVMRELSDRWEQSLVLKRLAEEAFEEAKAAMQ